MIGSLHKVPLHDAAILNQGKLSSNMTFDCLVSGSAEVSHPKITLVIPTITEYKKRLLRNKKFLLPSYGKRSI